MDPAKLVSEWQLVDVDFHVYNPDLDSYLTVPGTNDAVPTDTSPIFGEFFGINGKVSKIKIDTNGDLNVTADPITENIGNSELRWSVNNYDNSVTYTYNGPRNSTNGLWKNGFKVTNYWPLYTSAGINFLEMSVTADELHQDAITVALKDGKTLRVKRITAVFRLP